MPARRSMEDWHDWTRIRRPGLEVLLRNLYVSILGPTALISSNLKLGLSYIYG